MQYRLNAGIAIFWCIPMSLIFGYTIYQALLITGMSFAMLNAQDAFSLLRKSKA